MKYDEDYIMSRRMKYDEDYSEPSLIRIRVYENKLEIINGGVPVRLRHIDAELSVLSRPVGMTDSPRRSSAWFFSLYISQRINWTDEN